MTPARRNAVTTNPMTTNPVVTAPILTPSILNTIVTTQAPAPAPAPAPATNYGKSQTPSTTSPQVVKLPDNFGPSTTMAEVANYFAKVVLIELMGKFDVNTNMNLRDLLSVMAKDSSNTGSNNNGNASGNSSSNGNGNGNGNGSGSGNTSNNSASADLFKSLNVTVDPGVDNKRSGSNNANNTDTSGSPNNDMGMGSMGMGSMGMGSMGMGSMGMGSMGMGNKDDVTPKDTRSRLDIQNENANMELDNATRSSENKELNESIAKNEAELTKLKSDPTTNAKRIKELEAENQVHKNKITINENVMTDNERKKKANNSAIYKSKSNYEVASELGKGAINVTKSGVKAVGDAASSAYTATKNLVKGPDYDTINANREKLLDEQTVSNNKIAELQKQIDKTEDAAVAKKLIAQKDAEKKNLEKNKEKLKKNEELFQNNQITLQNIKEEDLNNNKDEDEDQNDRARNSDVNESIEKDAKEASDNAEMINDAKEASENANNNELEEQQLAKEKLAEEEQQRQQQQEKLKEQQQEQQQEKLKEQQHEQQLAKEKLEEKQEQQRHDHQLALEKEHAQVHRHSMPGGKKPNSKTKKTRKLQKR
jgi:unconventional prefoldin RPB5 interactor 1